MLAALTAGSTHAHQVGLSTVFVDLGSNRVTAKVIVAWQELENTIPLDADRDRKVSETELAAVRSQLVRLGESALSFESDGRMLSLLAPPDIRLDDTTGIRFQLTFDLPPTRILSLTSEILGELQRDHRQFVTVHDAAGAKVGETLLNRDKPTVEIPLTPTAAPARNTSTAGPFFRLGVEHILTGWDHLAFLFGLLIVGTRLREAVKIISSFTLAHSLTLMLAALHVINLPSSVVEPIIAASIIYVGFENVLRRDFGRRWMLTFAFGLIHGCGFAGALREAGLGADGGGVAGPLVFFNLGVEAGQLAIAAVLLPVIWKLRESFPRRWVPITSAALITVGSYFLIQRLWP